VTLVPLRTPPLVSVFDSSVLIAHLRGVAEATSLLSRVMTEGTAACSVLSRVEIEGGMRSAERASVSRLFAALEGKAVTDAVAGRAAEFLRTYRRSHPGIDIADYVIAATAETLGAELLTLNVKHFPMFEGLAPAF
jgi:predicted nucleic acid-binding protein